MVAKCPADNTAQVEQDEFFDFSYFDPHKIGWLICGCAAAVTCLLSLITIIGHARNYNKPLEQRQIIRVLLFPPVYAVVSFFSYRFFRYYEYWDLGEAAYEAFAIAAFLMLMLQYIGTSVQEQKATFAHKNKKPLPLPFCCWRYRPSKAYFLVLLKWSVVQYCIIRPAISIAGIVTEYYEVYCPSSLSYKYAYVYLTSIDFAAISIALYGLIVLYTLVKDDLKGRRPLAKFATIKLGIFLIFYQGFIFSLLASHGALHATQYWTTTNIADGLNALCTSLEMVLISAMQMWAFFWGEYYIDRLREPTGKANKNGKTNVFLSILHALNFTDILVELWYEIVFLFDRIRGKEYTRRDARLDFVQAFGAENDDDEDLGKPSSTGLELSQAAHQGQQHPVSTGDGTLINRNENPYGTGKEYSKAHHMTEYDDSMRSSNGLLRNNAPNQGTHEYSEQYGHERNQSGSTGQGYPNYMPAYGTQAGYQTYTGNGESGRLQVDETDHGAHARPRSWEPQAF
ncbi:hypothetical protein L7F22_050160 [Adiantum nelumboides]|nr:hypothetical protein [Adiantum nelumboides]